MEHALTRPSVLLADDNQGILQSLEEMLAPELCVVGTVRDGHMLLEAAARLEPDVIVADISMPVLDGLGALAQLRELNPGVRVVLITMYHEPALARVALDEGALGFVLKHHAPSELLDAIRAALDGKVYVSPAIASKLTR
jgi:DNA-binding NarL/FixJ family response regulator